MSKKKLKRNNHYIKQYWCEVINNLRRCKYNPNVWTIVTFRCFTSYFIHNGKELRRRL